MRLGLLRYLMYMKPKDYKNVWRKKDKDGKYHFYLYIGRDSYLEEFRYDWLRYLNSSGLKYKLCDKLTYEILEKE